MNDIEYFYSLSEKEQNQFLNNVVQNSSQIINKNNNYELFKPKRKSAVPDIEIGYHQKQGRLTYIAKLRNLHNNKTSCLCKCDCGNWYITRVDSFKNGDKGISAGGALSCGCKNNEVRNVVLHDKEIIKKRNQTIIKNLIEQNKIPKVGDIINGWTITASEMKNISNSHRRCVRAICPYCKQESDWIRYDNIITDHIVSCGCRMVKESFAVSRIKELLNQANLNYVCEKKFDDCRNPETNALLRFDFFVENKYLIEYDGEQHFRAGFGHNQQEFQKLCLRDKIKSQWAKDNNIPLIRLGANDKKPREITLEDLILETSSYIEKGE